MPPSGFGCCVAGLGRDGPARRPPRPRDGSTAASHRHRRGAADRPGRPGAGWRDRTPAHGASAAGAGDHAACLGLRLRRARPRSARGRHPAARPRRTRRCRPPCRHGLFRRRPAAQTSGDLSRYAVARMRTELSRQGHCQGCGRRSSVPASLRTGALDPEAACRRLRSRHHRHRHRLADPCRYRQCRARHRSRRTADQGTLRERLSGTADAVRPGARHPSGPQRRRGLRSTCAAERGPGSRRQ